MILFLPTVVIFFLWLKAKVCSIHKVHEVLKRKEDIVVGFFHPYFASNGGGERVLWTTILSMQKINPKITFVLYSCKENQDRDLEQVLSKAAELFDLKELKKSELIEKITVVSLRTSNLLRASTYPRLTLLLQSFGSMIAVFEAINRKNCDFFFDTTGFAFTFPVVKLYWLLFYSVQSTRHKKILAYVHYPTISLDMLDVIKKRKPSFNNSASVANSAILTLVKSVYYRIFAVMYGVAGKFSDFTFVNSSWTKSHVDRIWSIQSTLIFPPCNVKNIGSQLKVRKNQLVSLAQFRPEKNHILQLEAFSKLKLICQKESTEIPRFMLVGGCRNPDDFKRVEELKKTAASLDILDDLDFKVNCPYEELSTILEQSSIGIHTMVNEHFGIAPVEMQSKGLIVVAHDSGGPRADIIEHGKTGYLAEKADDFAQCIFKILQSSNDKIEQLRFSSIKSADRFSSENFDEMFRKSLT